MKLSLASLLDPLRPAAHTVRHYNGHKFRRDLVAGLTVSVVEIPQAMAYAIIAGVPPEYGIYTSVIQGILGALLSSGEHLASGPTNTQSLLIAAAATRIASPTADPGLYLELVFALTVLKGVIQLAFAAARMGNLIRYVSQAVILGVTSGAGVLIIVGQLPSVLGVSLDGTSSELPGVLGQFHRMVGVRGPLNPLALGVVAVSLLVIVGCRRISRFIPGSLIAVVLGAGGVWLLGLDTQSLHQVGDLPRSLPGPHLPGIGLEHVEGLIPGALALALLGLVESVAIVKAIAVRSGATIDPNREFLGQGLTNFCTGFLQCIPGSGSFTRTALDYEAGGQTRFAAVYNAVFVASIYLLLAPLAGRIPDASLASVLLVIAVGLIDWRYPLRTWKVSRADSAVFLITFVATILAPLQYAVFVGIFLNLSLYLRKASRLHVSEMIAQPGGRFLERPLADRTGDRPVMFLQVEGDLFFALADELQEKLGRIARGPVRVVILRLKRTHSIDTTVLQAIERFTRQMQARGGQVILCGLKPELLKLLQSYGLVSLIGRDNVFETGTGIFASAKAAIHRARELVGSSIDIEGLDVSDDPDAWAYAI